MLIKVYIWSVAGVCLLILFCAFLVWFNTHKQASRSSYQNNRVYLFYRSYKEGKMIFQVVTVFLPLINIIIAVLGFIMLTDNFFSWYRRAGRRYVISVARDPSVRFLWLQEIIIKVFFRRHLNFYYDEFAKELDKALKSLWKKDQQKKDMPEFKHVCTACGKEFSSNMEKPDPCICPSCYF